MHANTGNETNAWAVGVGAAVKDMCLARGNKRLTKEHGVGTRRNT